MLRVCFTAEGELVLMCLESTLEWKTGRFLSRSVVTAELNGFMSTDKIKDMQGNFYPNLCDTAQLHQSLSGVTVTFKLLPTTI